MGFRYNISGLFTKLTSYLCLMEENGHCMTEIYTDTKGEENCKVVRPWLRGNHLYSWFFTVDKRPRHWNDYPVADYQYRNETIVSLLLLGLNNCWNVC
uniref:Uncharacterized protein n=1 Tax=Plectus sambesii TaxID=2011161 RepID=A0A914UUG4_9BILA